MPTSEIDSGLFPSAVANRIVESAIQESVVLRLAQRVVMPAGVESVPVVSVAPQADFVGVGEPKPIGRIKWSSEVLKGEEIACVLSIPEAYVSDTSGSWDVEGSVENEMAKAIGARFDQAALWGDRAPASYPTGGLVGMAGSATGPDALTAISNAMGELEGEGIIPDGIAGGPSIGAALRAAYIEAGALPGESPANTIWGVPGRGEHPVARVAECNRRRLAIRPLRDSRRHHVQH
jgi:Phage capsid family